LKKRNKYMYFTFKIMRINIHPEKRLQKINDIYTAIELNSFAEIIRTYELPRDFAWWFYGDMAVENIQS